MNLRPVSPTPSGSFIESSFTPPGGMFARINVQVKVSMFAPSPVHPAHHSLVPRWVVHLGPVGLFLVAIVDSSVVPLPIPGTTDLLLLLFVVQGGNPWLLTDRK